MKTDAHRVILVTKRGSEFPCLVDESDYASLNARRWHLTYHGYAVRTMKRAGQPERKMLMHRVVMGLTQGDGLFVDHINGDRLDNRRANLRLVTRAEQAQNVSGKGCASPYRGVTWYKSTGRWRARATVGGVEHSAGFFDDEIKAAEAARALRMRLMTHATGGLIR